MGLHPSTNLRSIAENDNLDEEDDTTWIGGVSAISIEDGDWCDNGIQENEINELASAVSCGKKSAI